MKVKAACLIVALGAFGGLGVSACATAPKSAEGRANLQAEAQQTLNAMRAEDPGLDGLLARSAGYAVFPNIGKGGFIAGAAYGKGVLFEHGQPTGYVDLSAGSVGAQIGAQSFSELIVFQNPWDVQNLKGGQFKLGGNISAVVLKAGASAATNFTDGIAVFTKTQGGVMAELSVSGQKINFKPLSG